MVLWRNTSLLVGLTAVAASAFAQGMAPAPAPTATPSPAPVQVPIVSPTGAFAASTGDGPIVNRPRLEKPSKAGSVELTWLGHAAWVLRSPAGTTVLVDPWLANPRAPQDFVMPETVDAILVTHGHADHLGQAVELSKKLHAPIIGSYELIEQLAHFGISNGIGTNQGGTTKIKDMVIHAVAATHSSSLELPPPMPPVHESMPGCPCHHESVSAPHITAFAEHAVKAALEKKMPAKKTKKKGKGQKEEPIKEEPIAAPPAICTCPSHHEMMPPPGPHIAYAGAALGFVIEMDNGPTIYHAGDTDLFGDMKLIAKRYKPEIALLPIGGTYTMEPKTAAWASHMLGVKEVLPMHYGTMPQLAGTPSQLREAIAELPCKHKARVVAPNPGERVSYMK